MIEPEARVKKLDSWDVRSSILFIGNMITAISYLKDPKYAYPVLNAYNAWMYDQWKYNYDRSHLYLPHHHTRRCCRGLQTARPGDREGREAGIPRPYPYNAKAPAHPDNDPFWAMANEAGIRVVFHVSEAIYTKHHMALWGEPMQQSRIRQSAFVWMHGYSEWPGDRDAVELHFLNCRTFQCAAALGGKRRRMGARDAEQNG